ncbi:DUF4190 domain-containing protein [Streptomyces sp. NBC_01478]|uniref:DUF4190 domain-containing protein n=1 Tax=Streptomyces sp. NBC_01478 TaxID=2903882 RepID=UPI002E378087|nr:DUF4190 domain-containing protein [Streptomyces sp. NBC_01478]
MSIPPPPEPQGPPTQGPESPQDQPPTPAPGPAPTPYNPYAPPQQDPYAPPAQTPAPYGAQPQPPYGTPPQTPYVPYPQGPHTPPGPPSPYGPQPYQTWSQGYTPYNNPAPLNGMSVAALVLGILCCVPGVGLVLGLIALNQIKKRGERGRSMAAAGMVLSAFGLVVGVLGVTGAATGFWDDVKDSAPTNSSASPVKGECFDAPSGSLEGRTYDFDVVPCSGEHDGEVFAVVRMTGGSYPGDKKVTATADDKCYALQDAYAMDGWAVPADVDIYYVTPTSDSWSQGDREITCVFGNTDEEASLPGGSLRNDATTLDSDQVAYLKAAHVLNTALDSAPDAEYVEDDLPGHKAWAGRVSTALTRQADLLDGHQWPAASEKPVAALVKDLRAAQKEWAKASEASDADEFYAHYDKGADLIDPQKSVTARKALGLATTPPSYDENGGGGDSGGGDTGLEV